MRAYSASKLFVISVVVLTIALGGAFVNFQLIALPMAELVPAGARIGGVPVATISALVIVLMEAAVGIFVMDMLGITELFPKLASIPSSRRRLILGLGLAALFFLASVESSLAILREQIAEADSALKLALAGEEGRVVSEASSSRIPVLGQAVLGFVLPWVLAWSRCRSRCCSQRPLRARRARRDRAPRVRTAGARLRTHRRARDALLASLYDVYIAVPLRLEGWSSRRRGDDRPGAAPTSMKRVQKRAAGEGVA